MHQRINPPAAGLADSTGGPPPIPPWAHDTSLMLDAAQKLVDTGLGARLGADLLDDDRACEGVGPVRGGQGARDDNRTGGHLTKMRNARLALINPGALTDENAHRDDRSRTHDDAFDDLRACSDEAVVFDD